MVYGEIVQAISQVAEQPNYEALTNLTVLLTVLGGVGIVGTYHMMFEDRIPFTSRKWGDLVKRQTNYDSRYH